MSEHGRFAVESQLVTAVPRKLRKQFRGAKGDTKQVSSLLMIHRVERLLLSVCEHLHSGKEIGVPMERTAKTDSVQITAISSFPSERLVIPLPPRAIKFPR